MKWRMAEASGRFAAQVLLFLVFFCSTALAEWRQKADIAETLKSLGPAGSDARIAFTANGDIRFLGAPSGQDFTPPLKGESHQIAIDFIQRHAKSFGARSAHHAFSMHRIQHGKELDVVRLKQTYAGIPVFGAQALFQIAKSGAIRCALADILRETAALDSGKVSLAPHITAEAAATIALRESEKNYRGVLLLHAAPELVIYAPEVLGISGGPALAWALVITGEVGAGHRERFFIDAHTGTLLLRFNLIPSARNRRIHDANNTSESPGMLVRAEGAPVSGLVDADRAYDFLGDTYDFYMAQHGRDSVDNAGMDLSATVRYCNSGSSCPSAMAYWDAGRMYFGQDAVADDVVAHELTHGVTEVESGLIYFNQSGAINESLSDVWGEFVDLTNGRGSDAPAVRWILGEDFGSGVGIRNMSHPPAFGDPDRTCSPNWYSGFADNGGVHVNSGVNNKLCFLLTDGGDFNGQSIFGMGIPTVAALYYEAQTNFLTPASDYVDLYLALSQAAINLGLNQAQRDNLEAACLAVEIHPGNTCRPSPLPPLNGDCESAIPMALGVSYSGDNARANGSQGICFDDDRNAAWYSFTPAASASYVLSLCSTSVNTDTTMGLFMGDCGTLQAMDCNDDSCGYYSEIVANLTAGVRYFIAVAGYGGLGGAFTLRVDASPRSGLCGPIGDASFELGAITDDWVAFDSAHETPLCDANRCPPIAGAGPRSGDFWAWLGGRTGDPAWNSLEQTLRIPPAAVGMLTSYLQIPRAESSGSLRILLDDNLLFTATEADRSTYQSYKLIALDISAYADGDMHTLRLEGSSMGGAGATAFYLDDVCISIFGAPVNDECAGALPLDLDSNIESSTLGATPSRLPACPGGYGNDLWFRFSPAQSGEYIFRLCGEGYDGFMELWSACDGQASACHHETCVAPSSACLPLNANETYLLRVGGIDGGAGPFSLAISEGPCEETEAETQGEGSAEGCVDGMPEGSAEGVLPAAIHSADTNADERISLAELLRVIQLFHAAGLHCAEPRSSTEDGFGIGPGNRDCAPHDADYAPQDWLISLSELLRVIQFFNSGGYFPCPDAASEDGYCPGAIALPA